MPNVINAAAAERIRAFLVHAFERDARPRGSQAELARLTGVTSSAVNHWKQGASVPDEELWPTIGTYLGYAPDAIAVAATGRMPQPTSRPDLAADRITGSIRIVEAGDSVRAVGHVGTVEQRLADLEARVAELEAGRSPATPTNLDPFDADEFELAAQSDDPASAPAAVAKARKRHRPSPDASDE